MSRCFSISLFLGMLVFCGAGCFSGFDAPKKGTGPSGEVVKPRSKTASGDVQDKEQEMAQGYADAWTVICEAEVRSGAGDEPDRAKRGARVAAWIVANVKNKAARYWFIGFGRIEKKRRRSAFVAEAARAGIKDCALTKLLFAEGAERSPKSQPVSRPAGR